MLCHCRFTKLAAFFHCVNDRCSIRCWSWLLFHPLAPSDNDKTCEVAHLVYYVCEEILFAIFTVRGNHCFSVVCERAFGVLLVREKVFPTFLVWSKGCVSLCEAGVAFPVWTSKHLIVFITFDHACRKNKILQPLAVSSIKENTEHITSTWKTYNIDAGAN